MNENPADDDPTVQKVRPIFRELVRARAEQLEIAIPKAQSAIREALLAENYPEETARDIAFHLTDWNSDAAFIVALLLYPEKFSAEEIQQGVLDFVIHAPNHIAAAAKLRNWPVQDIFGIGAMEP